MASNHLLLPMLSTIYLRFEQVTWGVHELNPAFLPLLFCICHGVFLLNCVCATNWTYMRAITFGARDHVTFELGLVTQFRNFLFRGRGERILDIKKKQFSKISGSLERKWELGEFEYSPDILATFQRQKRRQNVFAYLPRDELSVRSQATAVSRALSSEHNKSDPEISKRQSIINRCQHNQQFPSQKQNKQLTISFLAISMLITVLAENRSKKMLERNCVFFSRDLNSIFKGLNM